MWTDLALDELYTADHDALNPGLLKEKAYLAGLSKVWGDDRDILRSYKIDAHILLLGLLDTSKGIA